MHYQLSRDDSSPCIHLCHIFDKSLAALTLPAPPNPQSYLMVLALFSRKVVQKSHLNKHHTSVICLSAQNTGRGIALS